MCDHNSAVEPVEGCPDCDKAVNRPIRKRFGAGSSSTVLPRPKPPQPDNGSDDERNQ